MAKAPAMITVRQYVHADAQALADIYYNTIHLINSADYSQQQVDAWAPSADLKTTCWEDKWQKLSPVVALINDTQVGFAEFKPNGHIDCFYVRHGFQRCGVGTALMANILSQAKKFNVKKIFAEVSITAKPFFIKQGFDVVEQQLVTIRGVQLNNFKMEKL